MKYTQDFPVENPFFPVENLWKVCEEVDRDCGKKSRYLGPCGKDVLFSTSFPQGQNG